MGKPGPGVRGTRPVPVVRGDLNDDFTPQPVAAADLPGLYHSPRSCRIASAISAGVMPWKCRCWPPS
jgi:hypothetical protein